MNISNFGIWGSFYI